MSEMEINELVKEFEVVVASEQEYITPVIFYCKGRFGVSKGLKFKGTNGFIYQDNAEIIVTYEQLKEMSLNERMQYIKQRLEDFQKNHKLLN